MTVECSNCGGIGPEFWLSLLALLLAAVAGWYAKRSADATDKAVALAHDEVQMARKEHEEFLRQLLAKARFRLTARPLYPEPDEDGVIRTNASTLKVRVEIGLKNVGERAAEQTVLNVVAPRWVANFRWSGPQGEEVSWAKTAAETPEELTDDDGRVHVGQYLSLGLARVTRRTHYARFFVLNVEVPKTGVVSVPLRVTADADELPDDAPEESERLMLRVARSQRG